MPSRVDDITTLQKCSLKAFRYGATTLELCGACAPYKNELSDGYDWTNICDDCMHELARIIKEDYKPTPRAPKGVVASINSSVISKFSWDPATETLYIQFKQGKVYSYQGVPQDVFLELYKAPSKGRFFAQIIKGTYHCKCLGVVSIPTPSELIVDVREDQEERYLQDYVEGVI